MTDLKPNEVAAVFSAFFAALALFVSAFATLKQARAADANLYLSLLDKFKERTALLTTSVGTNKETEAFVEFLNFLEGMASIEGERLLPRATRTMVRRILIESVALIRVSKHIHAPFVESATSDHTYNYLLKFEKRHSSAIERQIKLVAS